MRSGFPVVHDNVWTHVAGVSEVPDMHDWPAPYPLIWYHILMHSSLPCFTINCSVPYLFSLYFFEQCICSVFFFFACASKQADLPEEASNLSNLLISQSSELENWAQFFLFPRISAAKRGQEKMGKALKNFFLTCDTGFEERMELITFIYFL